MFRRLVICISPSHNTIFTPGLAIFFLATFSSLITWGVMVTLWRKRRFIELSMVRGSTLVHGPRRSTLSTSLSQWTEPVKS
jgi:hypothetical protein